MQLVAKPAVAIHIQRDGQNYIAVPCYVTWKATSYYWLVLRLTKSAQHINTIQAHVTYKGIFGMLVSLLKIHCIMCVLYICPSNQPVAGQSTSILS